MMIIMMIDDDDYDYDYDYDNEDDNHDNNNYDNDDDSAFLSFSTTKVLTGDELVTCNENGMSELSYVMAFFFEFKEDHRRAWC